MQQLNTSSLIVMAIVVLLAGALQSQEVAAESLMVKEGAATCAVVIEAEPAIGKWNVQAPVTEATTITSSGGYELKIDRSAEDKHAAWKFSLRRPDAQPLKVRGLSYEASVPLGNVAAVFDSQSVKNHSIVRQAPQLDAAIESRPNRGIPFMMGIDHYGENSLAIGAIDQTGTYRITGRRNGEQYSILIARQEYAKDQWFSGKELTDSIFFSTEKEFWYDTARQFADDVDRTAGYTPMQIPAAAELPYYSTWYSLGEKLDEKNVLEQARLASKIGCGNFLIFIGWSTCDDWFSSESNWGDYNACPSKFQDFAKLVKTIQDDLGMSVEVWVAPTWIGTKSKSFEKMADFRSQWPDGGFDRNLDPRSPAARQHIRERFAHLAKTTGVNGFYVDFADTLYNRNASTHEQHPQHFGTAYEKFLIQMPSGFRSVQPEAIVTYRAPFANLLSKRTATVLSTSYNEGDWNQARMFAIAQRYAGRGVVNRADPIVLKKEEIQHRDTVGRAISSTLLLGPPGISMDLTALSEGQLEQIESWFAFYKQHRHNIVHGELRPFGQEYHQPELMVHHGDTAYAWISRWETGEIPFPAGTKHAFIFTALPEDPSFIARIHPGNIRGLAPGKYRARWFNSSVEAHEDWFDMEFAATNQRAPNDTARPLRTARENWDFHPIQEKVVSLDIRRGGYLELKLSE
ncbi:MAG: hypothetical protein SGJ20_11800 [Planctomycetota bacterium]|nr:hypothetical protein [Planctomycetota bacterium]